MKLLLLIVSLLFSVPLQAQSLQLRFSGLDSFSAEFNQKLFDADQVMQEESSGILRVQRPNRFNLEYRQPYYQLYIADGKDLYFYDKDLEQVTVKAQEGMLENTPAMLLSNPSKLDDLYDVKPQGEEHDLFWYQLTPKQRFYVIFYSDTAYPMLHPKPATQLAPATPQNKEALRYWLDTVPLCLKTNGKQAIQAAFNLQPDVIFVLGDGAFTDKAADFFAARPQNRIPLHTLGMDVKPDAAESFRRLAQANGGTYRDVTVSPGAAAMAKSNPRPRNTVRGEIWGITLKPAVNLK